jgi:S1-C subfamily serine protease
LHGGELPITIAGTEFLLGGDIITELNGQVFDDPEDSAKRLGTMKVGDHVHLTFYRREEKRTIELDLPERPILPGDLRSNASNTLFPIRDGLGRTPLR